MIFVQYINRSHIISHPILRCLDSFSVVEIGLRRYLDALRGTTWWKVCIWDKKNLVDVIMQNYCGKFGILQYYSPYLFFSKKDISLTDLKKKKK